MYLRRHKDSGGEYRLGVVGAPVDLVATGEEIGPTTTGGLLLVVPPAERATARGPGRRLRPSDATLDVPGRPGDGAPSLYALARPRGARSSTGPDAVLSSRYLHEQLAEHLAYGGTDAELMVDFGVEVPVALLEWAAP